MIVQETVLRYCISFLNIAQQNATDYLKSDDTKQFIANNEYGEYVVRIHVNDEGKVDLVHIVAT